MAFFSKMLKNIKRRRPMMAKRMGSFLRNRPQLMERLRNVRGMRGMGRSMMNPNMQFGIMGLNPMMARSMKAKMMGLPDPQDFDANNLPFPEPLKRPDIMPQDPGFGVNLPKPRPIMPGVMPPSDITSPVQPQPTGPIRSVIEPVDYQPPKEDFSGYLSFYDNPPVPGMAGGGGVNKEEPKEYPNEGLAALAKVAPEVVKSMGFANGGEISLYEIMQRLNRSMGSLSKDEMDLLKDMYSDGRFSAGDMMQKVKDFRAGKFMPRKFEDLETKRTRLSKSMGTGQYAQKNLADKVLDGASREKRMADFMKRMTPSKEMIQGGLRSLTRLPKFSIPSAVAGFGAGYLLDNLFDDKPQGAVKSGGIELLAPPEEYEDPQPAVPEDYFDRERMQRIIESGSGRSLSEEDLRIASELVGRPLSPRQAMEVFERFNRSNIQAMLAARGRTISDLDRDIIGDIDMNSLR